MQPNNSNTDCDDNKKISAIQDSTIVEDIANDETSETPRFSKSTSCKKPAEKGKLSPKKLNSENIFSEKRRGSKMSKDLEPLYPILSINSKIYQNESNKVQRRKIATIISENT